MLYAYPAIFSRENDGDIIAFVPDFNIGTQGTDLADAIRMTRDLIGAAGIDMLDDGKELPQPFEVKQKPLADNEVLSIVDIDFEEYRRIHDMRTVRRNVSLPNWLNVAADKAGLNVSALLQNALKKELNIK